MFNACICAQTQTKRIAKADMAQTHARRMHDEICYTAKMAFPNTKSAQHQIALHWCALHLIQIHRESQHGKSFGNNFHAARHQRSDFSHISFHSSPCFKEPCAIRSSQNQPAFFLSLPNTHTCSSQFSTYNLFSTEEFEKEMELAYACASRE